MMAAKIEISVPPHFTLRVKVGRQPTVPACRTAGKRCGELLGQELRQHWRALVAHDEGFLGNAWQGVLKARDMLMEQGATHKAAQVFLETAHDALRPHLDLVLSAAIEAEAGVPASPNRQISGAGQCGA